MNPFFPQPIIRKNLNPAIGPMGKRCLGNCVQNPKGLTLIEVMIVVVIIGILSSMAIPTYFSSREKAKIAATVAEIKLLEKMIRVYNIDHEKYPDTLEDLGLKTFEDPWGNPYQYLKIEGREKNGKKKKSVGKRRKDHNMVRVNSDFDVFSRGKDGKSQTPFTAKASRDDIVRANNGRYIGLVSDY
jgi:general secretion pathway protein G